ncbi:MAG: hypothetical protein M0Z95_21425 [Actinomycetota bacterium]|jgi:hypothetical protein|nr:hypothetical protein [Actinomycetota bacterium]
MRWSVGKMTTTRGAGLGNEVFPWAKAYLGAIAFDARLVDPPFLLNPRRYDRELDVGGIAATIRYLAVHSLPATTIDQPLLDTLGAIDYYDAMCALRARLGTKSGLILRHTTGMQNGYLAIRRARPFLRSRLLGTESALRHLASLPAVASGVVTVGLHIRGGDFDSQGQVTPGVFNATIPEAWYRDVLDSVHRELGLDRPLQVYVASNLPGERLADLLDLPGCSITLLSGSATEDLAVLASCDFIIPSISSYSLLAIFLSDAFYCWPQEHLNDTDGWLSIWGHESSSGGPPTTESIASQGPEAVLIVRGIPVQAHTPSWPRWLPDALAARALVRASSTDLCMYGVVRRAQ